MRAIVPNAGGIEPAKGQTFLPNAPSLSSKSRGLECFNFVNLGLRMVKNSLLMLVSANKYFATMRGNFDYLRVAKCAEMVMASR